MAGLGCWACHADEDVTPVHTGKCFRAYQLNKEELRSLGLWLMMCPEIGGDEEEEA